MRDRNDESFLKAAVILALLALAISYCLPRAVVFVRHVVEVIDR